MDIEKIENFLVFTEYLNFTEAADKVFMDTSVFHRQISSLEKELNIRLIQRNSRSMSLTPAGESFARGMRDVLELYHIEVQKAANLNAGIRGSIHLCNIVGHEMTPAFSNVIGQFEAAYPDISVFVINKSMAESRVLLKKGHVDFAVARDENYSMLENIDTLLIGKMRAGFAIHEDLLPPEAADGSFDESILDRYPMIWCRQPASSQGLKFIQEREKRLGTDSIIWVKDLETTYSYVELKRGFTLINDLCFFRNLPEIRYFPSDIFGEIRHSLVWSNENPNPCIKVFADFVRSHPERFGR